MQSLDVGLQFWENRNHRMGLSFPLFSVEKWSVWNLEKSLRKPASLDPIRRTVTSLVVSQLPGLGPDSCGRRHICCSVLSVRRCARRPSSPWAPSFPPSRTPPGLAFILEKTAPSASDHRLGAWTLTSPRGRPAQAVVEARPRPGELRAG